MVMCKSWFSLISRHCHPSYGVRTYSMMSALRDYIPPEWAKHLKNIPKQKIQVTDWCY